MLSTVARSGKVLNLFTPRNPEWGVTDAARTLGLPKSNTHEIMASLSAIGLLQRTPSGRYRLGWRLLSYSNNLVLGAGFESVAQHVVADLASRLGETATVGAWDGHRVVCVASRAPTRSEPACAPGARLPGHASALGKLLMAQLPWETVLERVSQYGLPRLTSDSVVDTRRFRRQLDEIAHRGISYEHGETLPGYSCVASGILGPERRVVAALSLCSRTSRMRVRHREFAVAVRNAAGVLSDRAR
ncbi:IclR family transcriptional regulator [Rhodococcus opacus]|uniref:IclR family transcriptional regulator n=1 Tax=Rhodococcus opacus TaxID=37919 RepID=UPI000FFC9CAC|nr:IclR family transcriptional regulator [Rhodococcus opacus]